MRSRLWCLLGSAGLVLAMTAPVLAQTYDNEVQQTSFRPRKKGNDYCPIPCPPTCPSDLTAPVPTPTPTPTPTPAPTPTPPPDEPTISPEQFAATGGGESFAAASSAVGYIDPALPVTRFRLRYDSAWGNNRPDRAEYFYAKCGCFKVAGLDPDANGPILMETKVDYQEIRPYFEYAIDNRFSAFLEAPVRFIDPAVNPNAAGLSDMIAGAKAAMILTEQQVLSFQFKTFIPTGASTRGLGTDHVSLEPGLLYFRQLSERLALESELKWWVPIDGTDFAGNVVQYGAGLGYRAFDNGSVRVIPVMEYVGWTVIGGKEFLFPEAVTENAGGDTIINGKFGVRTGFGQLLSGSQLSRLDVYAGYGRAFTGEVWYKNMFRLEARLNY